VVTSDEGCLDTLCADIEISNNVKVWVPTGFTPNDDELNAGFSAVLDGKEYVTNYNLQVFDRRGVMVFESASPDKSWNGENERGADNPQGVYHWLITMNVFGEAYPREYRGTVTLLR
jgi:gliding motility-associated-like protein